MITNNGVILQITYHGGDGNDVALIQQNMGGSSQITKIEKIGAAIQLTGTGQPNASYTVQAAESLNPPIQWQSIGVAVANGAGVIQFIDADSISGRSGGA